MHIPHAHRKRNWISYYLWRWLLKSNGKFSAHWESFFWGPSRGLNDYDSLGTYKQSHIKPDKHYSILPTVLQLVGDCTGKTVIDLGCGTGFFTIPCAELGAQKVYGIDNSRTQLDLALRTHDSISYHCRDIFVDPLPSGDIIVAPFVANYAHTVPILQYFFKQLHTCLHENGRIVLVVDLPNGKHLQRFGAVKRFTDKPTDEAQIEIDLFNGEQKVCTLTAVYFTPETIEQALMLAGFSTITWHKPIVSEEGIKSMEAEFWNGYTDDSELGYITARK